MVEPSSIEGGFRAGMSDTGYLVKGFVLVGVLAVFVSLLLTAEPSNPIPDRGEITSEVSPWGLLTDTLEAGIDLPEFSNPFSENYAVTTKVPDANDLFNNTDYVSVTGCTNATYWECVRTNDDDTSYVTLGTGGLVLFVNTTDPNYDGVVMRLVVTIWCRSITDAPPFEFFSFDGGTEFVNAAECPVSTEYSVLAFDLTSPWVLSNISGAMTGVVLDDELVEAGQTVRITYLTVTMYTQRDAACSGFECVNRFFDTMVKGTLAIINGIVFIVVSVAQILIFIGKVIAGFVLGIVGSFIWFLTPSNIGNPPAIVMTMLAVALLAPVGVIFWVIAKFFRGSESVGV